MVAINQQHPFSQIKLSHKEEVHYSPTNLVKAPYLASRNLLPVVASLEIHQLSTPKLPFLEELNKLPLTLSMHNHWEVVRLHHYSISNHIRLNLLIPQHFSTNLHNRINSHCNNKLPNRLNCIILTLELRLQINLEQQALILLKNLHLTTMKMI